MVSYLGECKKKKPPNDLKLLSVCYFVVAAVESEEKAYTFKEKTDILT